MNLKGKVKIYLKRIQNTFLNTDPEKQTCSMLAIKTLEPMCEFVQSFQ